MMVVVLKQAGKSSANSFMIGTSLCGIPVSPEEGALHYALILTGSLNPSLG